MIATTPDMFSHVVTRGGVEYRVTGATYLGAHSSATNGPLWVVHAERWDDDVDPARAGAYWHESTAPVIGLRPCDTSDPCPSARAGRGCYLHEVRAEL